MPLFRYFLILLVFGTILCACTQPNASKTDDTDITTANIEVLSTRTAKILNAGNIENLSAYIEKSMEALLIPGAALAIVQDGQIITEAGYGVKEIGGDPVSPHTRFLAASTTKGMTTLLLEKAVEMGLANWNDPVIKHYPKFQIGDKELTKSVLIRHLVCACTGLSRMDLDWIYNNGPDTPITRVFDHLKTMQPNTALGETFQYSNQLAAASGYVAGKIFYPDMEMGAAYDRAMQTYVFDPLGMSETTFDIQKALAGDIALPYAYDFNGDIAPVEQTKNRGFNHAMVAFRPTGGAWTNVHDMIKYVRNETLEGLGPDGKRLFSREHLLDRRKPNVLAAPGRYYGMGFYIEDFSGIEVVRHSGSMCGYRSEVIIIPGANVGAVIMSNGRNGYGLVRTFTRRLIEELYDGKPLAEKQVLKEAERHRVEISKRQSDLVYPVPGTIKNILADSYSSPKLGELKVMDHNASVYFDTGMWGMSMAAKIQDDSEVMMVSVEPGIPYEFSLGKVTNGLSTLTITVGQNTYVFTENTK